MRMHWNKYVTALMLAGVMTIGSMTAFANDTNPVVETITLDEALIQNSTVLADLGWKTAQDKGQWIEEMGIAKDMTSLILVINSQDSTGKSRLTYFSKGMDEEWSEVFSVDCYLSNGGCGDIEEIYGAYEPVSAFGNYENPGSLLPFRALSSFDYWSLNPEDDQYGSIFAIEADGEKPEQSVSLEALKAYSGYGMILHPEDAYASCPALMINCQQKDFGSDAVNGIHMPQDKVRMLIQSIDSGTRIVIAGSLDELKHM